MTRLKSLLLTLVLMAAFTALPRAHEQRFLGWVTALEGAHVHIKTTEHKTVVVMLHAKTKIVRGTEPQAVRDITVGDRIVATTTDGKDAKGRATLRANEIRLGTGAGAHQAPATGEVAVIEKWLAEYDAAFNAKDLEKLGTFYHPDVTIYEGGGIDNGWAAYRDGHLGPELKAFENLDFAHSNRQIHLLGDGKTAYAISQYSLKAKMGERAIDAGGLETLVLVKGADGAWKIRHSHTSSRPRRPPQ